MNSIHLPTELQEQVHDYFHLTLDQRERQEEFDILLSLLKPTLKNKVQRQFFLTILFKNTTIIDLLDEKSEEANNYMFMNRLVFRKLATKLPQTEQMNSNLLFIE
mmetsp:Transcript_499/g.510  ORF Transcript_499/g.510 Transcript_499/m.510 type:complete len:105 (+) Transcript_499:1219-1533(+)